jgi:hypothetical protein
MSAVAASVNYRLGFWLMLVVALLGDPMRKVIYGHPVYISVAFLPIFTVVFFKVLAANRGKHRVFFYFPKMKRPFQIFLVILAVNALRPIIANPESLPMVLYGLAQYAGWILVALMGFCLINKEEDLIKFAKVYMLTVTPFLITVPFHLWGFEETWPILQTMEFGSKAWLYYPSTGGVLRLINGTFRFPEVMGWHAMTASICALYILFRDSKRLFWRIYSPCFSLFATYCALLSVRRKYLLGIAIFIALFLALGMKKNIKKAIGYIVVFIVLFGIGSHYLRQAGVDAYVQQGGTGFQEAISGFNSRALGSIQWALERDGFFGRGVGTTAQGSRHVSAFMGTTEGGFIEAGPGKVVSDIGIPGLLIFAIMMLVFLKSSYKMLFGRSALKVNMVTTVFLLSMVLVNLISFSLSHQIYADPLIGMLTGLGFGFLLAVPKMVEQVQHK